uniref:3Beta_HSD domain-containing protein n=1 Tax=Globodera pallida TaxID=36090 RepID=A0A183CCR3_GLOPA
MEQIAIIGCKTLIGAHLVKAFDDTFPSVKKNLWDYTTDGLDKLRVVLKNCDVVFNLHEVQDFCVAPNVPKLKGHNVQFVHYLLRCCQTVGCRRIVHLSSVYLQASDRWPNVHGCEAEDFDPFRKQCPFPEYCESKFAAEQSIRAASNDLDIQSIIARVGPLYGEGDRHSLLCDSILLTKMIGAVPLIGDQGGTLQFTYAGNAAHALLQCAKKFFAPTSSDDGTDYALSSPIVDDEKVQATEQLGTETVLISDCTPLKDSYRLLLEPLMADDDDIDENGQKASETKGVGEIVQNGIDNEANDDDKKSIRIGHRRVPFLGFYVFYWLVSMLVRLRLLFGGRSCTMLYKMPCPKFLYMLFHNWTFFSDFKLRIFFDFVPATDWPTSLRRSRHYYRQLKAEQIADFSWVPLI